MDISSEAIRLITEKSGKPPNGHLRQGLDNTAFHADDPHDTGASLPFIRKRLAETKLNLDLFTGAFGSGGERDNDPADDYMDGEGGSDVDSVRSQHDGQETMTGGSIGRDSRLGDFDDELNVQTSAWDVFEETTWTNLAHADRKFWSRVNIVSRIVLIVFLFVLVLGVSSLSSFTFLVIVYNMNAAVQNYTLPGCQLLQPSGDVVNVRWVWAAMMVTSSPYLFTLVSCLRTMCVKKVHDLALRPLLMALTVETLHSVGLGLFVFMVAPSYDPLMVITLSQAVISVPAALKVYRVVHDDQLEETHFSWRNFGVLIAALIFVALVVYRLHHNVLDTALAVITPLSLIFLSVEWWENFICVKKHWRRLRRKEIKEWKRAKQNNPAGGKSFKKQNFVAGSFLFRAKLDIRDRDRMTKIEALCAVWKIFLNMVIPTVLFASRGSPSCVSALFFSEDSATDCSLWNLDLVSSRITGAAGGGGGKADGDLCSLHLPFLLATVSIIASGIAYKAAKVSCKIHAQRLCFALPLLLSAPLTCVVSLLTYSLGGGLGEFLGCPSCLRWPELCGTGGDSWLAFLRNYTEEYWLPLFFLGLLVLALTSTHVWSPSSERLASTQKLFVRPLYCGVMFAQSLLLNRAVDDTDRGAKSESTDINDWTSRYEKTTAECEPEEMERMMKGSSFPMIYACATMWRETAQEMAQLLKSIFRMDQDQFTRECMWKMFNVVDKDFYNFEAHIFFDDAFEREVVNGTVYYAVNSYVKQLLGAVDEAARDIYPANATFLPPTKTDTPYGGRLTYTLPGCNQLVVHLKNKFLIRNKKRWSQVMYMYYLLAFKLLQGEPNGSRRRQAHNTYVLALDGDVDFYPDAVQLLVDRMKRNGRVGAACSRIHPIGSGLMVWYQKFEYAVSHWLQKTTEHMFGCVLCSPGCFSLFRGSALMKDNVLRRYTKMATTGRHAVQYDMGEDRWLCTLLLQQGFRVEYVAAADALTFCPDNFEEFYKQRRRWTPSTLANILDLLSDWRHVTKVNGSISLAFIAYQAFLFVSSMVTPGTIFLLILGAINTAYPTIPLYAAMILNLLPVIIFVVLCFTASGEVQIAYATILSTLYSLVMMVVVVGLLRQIAESGMCSITAIFFVGVAGIFCLAALLHPQEATIIFYGLIYFLAIPSMSMLLVFYAVANLNVVSWGTRDAGLNAGNANSGAPKRQPPTMSGGLDRLHKGLKNMVAGASGGGGGGGGAGGDDVTSEYTFSFGNLFRCICCPTKKGEDVVMERFDGIEDTLSQLKKALLGEKSDARNDRTEDGKNWPADDPEASSPLANWSGFYYTGGDRMTSNPLFRENEIKAEEGGAADGAEDVPDREFWFEDPKLDSGLKEDLDSLENRFWEELIEKYLKPLDQIPEHSEAQKKIKMDLTSLRNKAAMFFFLSNTLFVTVIFILESVSEYTPGLTIELPCDRGHAGQKIEPISVTFTVTFGILLLLQLVGMLMHRYSTFVHIAASTTVRARKEGSASENYTLYGQHPYYHLTIDMLHQDDHRQTPGSTYTNDQSSFAPGRSVSDDTVIDPDTVHRIRRRQTARNASTKPQNLYEIVREGIRPIIDVVDNNEGEDEDQREATPMEEGDARGTGSEDEGSEHSGDDERTSDAEAAPAASAAAPTPNRALTGWSRARSMKFVMAMDPARRALVKQRTDKEAAQTKWKEKVNRLMALNALRARGEGGGGLTGSGAGGARPGEGGGKFSLADVVRAAQVHARHDAAEGMTGHETAKDTKERINQDEISRTTSVVSFADVNEIPAGGINTRRPDVFSRRVADPQASASRNDPSSSLLWRSIASRAATRGATNPVSPLAERQAPGESGSELATLSPLEGTDQPEQVSLSSIHLSDDDECKSVESLSSRDDEVDDDDDNEGKDAITQL